MQSSPFSSDPSPLGDFSGATPHPAPVNAPGQNDARFSHPRYSIKKKFLQAFGGTFYLYDPNENLVLWGAQKAFKLKEDLRLYADENKQQEVLRIAARSIMDFSAAYDVYDAATNVKLGAFKRKGLVSSFAQDTWILMNAADQEIGQVQEDNMILALIRKFVDYATMFLPQKYHFTIGDQQVATFTQTKNPFSSKMEIVFDSPPESFDRRLALALAMLLSAVEGRQG